METEGTNVVAEAVNLPPPPPTEVVRLISMSKDGRGAEVVVIKRGKGGRKVSFTKHLLFNPKFPGGLSDVDGRIYKL